MSDATQEKLITDIAVEHLMIETLQEQGRDSLDFHSCSVTLLKRALEAAYEAGHRQAQFEALTW